MTLQEAIEEIFGHGFLFTLRPTKARKALWIIHKALQEYQDQQQNPTLLRWIPCSERMPGKHGFYLVYMESYDRYAVMCFTENKRFWNPRMMQSVIDSITHWMPVPDAPAKEKPPQNAWR